MVGHGVPRGELMEFNEKRTVPGETAREQAQALLRILRGAHWTNVVVRTGGRTILYEADFLRDWLQECAPEPPSGDKTPRGAGSNASIEHRSSPPTDVTCYEPEEGSG